MDVDAYCARIGYRGTLQPTLATLAALHALHPAAIPFENLTPLMEQPVSLAVADLEAKLVRGGRGGYCYEHNGLFKAVLQTLGFQVSGLAARVLWNAPAGAPARPRSHMALLVTLPEGRYVADVGFGGVTLTAPLALDLAGQAQATPHERFRLAASADGYAMQVEIGEEWRAMFRFDLAPCLDVDYEPLNWFTATHPHSVFRNSLMAARALPDRRLALADGKFTVRPRAGAAQERQLTSIDAVAEVLVNAFGVSLPQGFAEIGPKLGFY